MERSWDGELPTTKVAGFTECFHNEGYLIWLKKAYDEYVF